LFPCVLIDRRDLETGAIIGVTVQDADDGDTETSIETLIEAAEQIGGAA
jgi:hypothetical protein